MAEPARVLPLDTPNGYGREPDEQGRIRGNGRAIAVAKFRELADKLESGELGGARVQWLDTHGEHFDEDGLPTSGLEFVTRTAHTANGSGTVSLKAITIEEV